LSRGKGGMMNDCIATTLRPRQPLSEIASTDRSGSELLRGLLSALLFALKNLNEYLLPPDGSFWIRTAFSRTVLREDFRFCYYPENPASFSGSLKKFSEFLLPRLNHDDERAVMLGYSFYSECVNDTLSEGQFFSVCSTRSRREMPKSLCERK
jgi:hypothetical protein